MGRKNFNTKHGRRLAGHPTAFAQEPNTIGTEGMARELVRRGLASELILDYPVRDETPPKRRNH